MTVESGGGGIDVSVHSWVQFTVTPHMTMSLDNSFTHICLCHQARWFDTIIKLWSKQCDTV